MNELMLVLSQSVGPQVHWFGIVRDQDVRKALKDRNLTPTKDEWEKAIRESSGFNQAAIDGLIAWGEKNLV